jgi:hypothetical protein
MTSRSKARVGFGRLLAATALAGAILAPHAPEAAPKPNWFLGSIKAVSAAKVHVRFVFAQHRVGQGPMVGGLGESLTGPGTTPNDSYVWVANIGHDGSERYDVTTSRPLGGHRIPLPAQSGAAFSSPLFLDWVAPAGSFDYDLRLARGQTYALLLFWANGVFDGVSINVRTLSGKTQVVARTGSGATAMLVADPGSDGYAAGAEALAAGMRTVRANVGRGLVGAIDDDCRACAGSWSGPGRSGEFKMIDGLILGRYNFAGPAGAWSWEWTGALGWEAGQKIIGAWAPVGDGWRLFANLPEYAIL